MLNVLFLVAALAAPHENILGDWAVACDNVARCEATALQAPEQAGNVPSQMLVTREPGPGGALGIAIDPAELVKGPVTLRVDGRQVATGTIGDNYRLRGAEAAALAKAMAAGSWLELRGGARVLARISLAGIAATLRYIDDAQGRAGTVTALIAAGPKPASAVPAAAALPVVPALRSSTKAPENPTPALLGALVKSAGCDPDGVIGDLPVERYRLDAEATLVLIACGRGAYNFSSAAFILRGGEAEPAAFDTPPDWIDNENPAIVTNASFSTSDGAILTSSTRGRGPGDCGTSLNWVWDGSRFRTIEARMLDECRGSINWLTVFRATPAWR
jgi:uncharacterized protein DUF1176